ncbi:MAG: restriction endonuclease subunit S [Verrucomicrobiota bacterium]
MEISKEHNEGGVQSRHCRVPDGWQRVTLSDIAKIQTGISKSAARKVDDPVELPYLRVANVQDGHIDLSNVQRVTVSQRDIERFSLRKDDVLLTEGGDFDKLGRGHVWHAPVAPCLHQNHVFAIRVDPSKILPYYLAYYTAGPLGRRYFLSCSKQTTNLASINSTQLKALPVALPPLPEQRKIAEILSTWDRAIEQTEKLIEAKKQLKKGLMQQLLTGKLRFPQFGEPRTDSDELPTYWEALKAGSLFERSTERGGIGDPVLSVTQEEGVVRRDSLDRKIAATEGSTNTYKLVRPGDFVISLRSFQGGLEYSPLRGKVSPAYHVIRARIPIVDDFYRHFFKSFWFVGHLATAVIGIRDGKQVSFGDFEFLSLPNPPLKEQEQIAQTLSACDAGAAALKKKLAALQKQKRGLMQKLLTGAIRVRDVD